MNRLADRRLSQASKRKEPDSEITAVLALYKSRFEGCGVKRFCTHYRHNMLTQAQPVCPGLSSSTLTARQCLMNRVVDQKAQPTNGV